MSGFRTIGIVAWNTFQDNLRSRYYLLCLVFGGVVLYVSLLLGLLAADQEVRVVLDFGLSLIELLGLAAAVYGAATIVLREMETKTIYLILTRPVSRSQYLVGRFAGLMLSTAAVMAAMAALHLPILFWKGWAWSWLYPASIAGSFLKLLITAALTMFLALASSSILTALVITMILWTLGHFLPEIRFMIRWNAGAQGAISVPLTALSYVVPDLQLLNLRDMWERPAGMVRPVAYALAYAGVWVALAAARLRRKEF
jgi:ABC-type transport system involved in multi-copper enzyme maturation permease subunit